MRGAHEQLAALKHERLGQPAAEPLGHQDRLAASSTRSHSTMNSSPPKRATVSEGRIRLFSRSATRHSSRSPASWPRLSLTSLNRSRSRNRSATPYLVRSARGQCLLGAIHQQGPVGQPGQRVVQRLVGQGHLGPLALHGVAHGAQHLLPGGRALDQVVCAPSCTACPAISSLCSPLRPRSAGRGPPTAPAPARPGRWCRAARDPSARSPPAPCPGVPARRPCSRSGRSPAAGRRPSSASRTPAARTPGCPPPAR